MLGGCCKHWDYERVREPDLDHWARVSPSTFFFWGVTVLFSSGGVCEGGLHMDGGQNLFSLNLLTSALVCMLLLLLWLHVAKDLLIGSNVIILHFSMMDFISVTFTSDKSRRKPAAKH